MLDTKEKRKLSSSESTRISLEAMRLGEAGLNQHRQGLLNRVPKQNDWVALERETVTVKYIEQKKSLIVSYITGEIEFGECRIPE